MGKSIHKALSEEIIKFSSFQEILVSLIGLLLVISSVNFIATFLLKSYTLNRANWLIKHKWELLLDSDKKSDLLVLGDSSCNQGVIPSILEENLGKTAVNLCTIGNLTTLNDAWMLDRYIQKFGAPRQVVIVHVYDVWRRRANSYWLSKIPLSLKDYSKLQPQVSYGLRGRLSFLESRYLLLYTDSESLADWIRFPQKSLEKLNDFQLDENGFMVLEEPRPERVQEDTSMHIEFTQKSQFVLSAENKKALDSIAVLAKKYDFQVYLVNSPLYEGLYENRDFRNYYDQVQTTLKSYTDNHSNFYLVFQKPMTFPENKMENADHLIYSSAKTFTSRLAAEITAIQGNN